MTTLDDAAIATLTADMLEIIERIEDIDDPQVMALFKLLIAGFEKEFADND